MRTDRMYGKITNWVFRIIKILIGNYYRCVSCSLLDSRFARLFEKSYP